ncbi:hypothetical protein A0H81_07031 [Grifola frondosa]|uniref:Major facilitator superfamily (MFS) profile domain-containing protein n=1 Tax=Grifola frondosa TaxID=5627 RepID=A0A1C7M8P7_GRIFR|nr:hypothetical protein A0H81_07031 [Grifola frondosa]
MTLPPDARCDSQKRQGDSGANILVCSAPHSGGFKAAPSQNASGERAPLGSELFARTMYHSAESESAPSARSPFILLFSLGLSLRLPCRYPWQLLDREQREPEDDDVNSQFEREAYGPEVGEKDWDEFEITMGPDDPQNPHNWSRLYRWYITLVAGFLVLNATFSSSAPSGVVPQLMRHFSFSEEVAILTISLFVGGYCIGPLVWGPLSEQIGRRPVFIFTFIVYTGFQVGCALAPNTASILIFRFLAGTFAAAPLSNSGAVIADIWDAGTRGKALAIFALAPFAGPTISPLVSGFMTVAGVSWRWLFWLLTMFSGSCLVLTYFTLPETFVPILLVKRAEKMRKETGDDRYWAPLERKKMTVTHADRDHTFMSFIYGCIYLLFEAYPIVFTKGHHMNLGISGLMFLPIFIGGFAGVVIYLIFFNPRYEQRVIEFAPHPVPPEYRMEICLWAAPMYALAFFWFGWTSYPSVSYWAPLMAGIPLGWSIVWIFLSLFNYVIDTYLFVAASALSSMTVVRSVFGVCFPLFATQMYDTLNPRWASFLLACLATLMAPIPFVLRKYGPKLRHKSKYAPPLPSKIVVIPKGKGEDVV